MILEFYCSNRDCRQRLRVPEGLAGTKVQCPKCETAMTAPRSAAERPADERDSIEATQVFEREDASADQPDGGSSAQDETRTALDTLDGLLGRRTDSLGIFEWDKEIAHGGMGRILLCHDKTIGRPIAMKVMLPRIAESEKHRLRFLEEAQITGQLEHPNIVPIHEMGKDAEGNIYFTMKLVRGRSLGEILKEMRKGGPGPSLTEFLGVFQKACDGIAFAHSKGVIHRDLKPDNIMVGEFGEVQIMDWGLAKAVGNRGTMGPWDHGTNEGQTSDGAGRADAVPATQHSLTPSLQHSDLGTPSLHHSDSVRSIRDEMEIALTMEGSITGTPNYMPPEQAEGKIDELDQRSDVYSLGAILYEMLSLERAIPGGNAQEVLRKVVANEVVPPEERASGRDIPRELSAVARPRPR